jgi:hypothetical protein
MSIRVTAPARTTFTIAWNHDGARQLDVVVHRDLPPFGPMEQRIRGIAAIASSHGGLRMLLESALPDQLRVSVRVRVSVREGLAGVSWVRLVPLSNAKQPG